VRRSAPDENAVLRQNPLQACPKIFLHAAQHVAGELLKIQAFTKFRRNDGFPQPPITRGLPPIQFGCHVDRTASGVKSRARWILCSALSPYIPAARLPLPASAIPRMRHPYRTPLIEMPSGGVPGHNSGANGALSPR
jgi:hypothetical protein